MTSQVQYFATGSSGTDFAISSATNTHTFNLPTASATNRGALSSADWSSFNSKISGTGASGQIAYFTGSTSQVGNNKLFYDATNVRLGVGTNTPQSNIQISENKNGITNLQISNTTAGTSSQAGLRLDSDASSGTMNIGKYSSTSNAYLSIAARDGYLSNSNFGDITLQNEVATGKIKFSAGAASTAQMTLTSVGSLGIGTTSVNESAIVQIDSTTKGFLLPRMTTTQKNAISSPATGLQVYDTTLNLISSYNGTSWVSGGGGGGMAIGGSITSATAGSILFAGVSGVLQQDNANLFWDNTNKRLGIDTATPAQALSIIRDENISSGIEVQNLSTGIGANAGIIVRNSATSGQLFKLSTGYTTFKTLAASDLAFYNSGAGDISILNDFGTGNIKFAAGGSSTAQMTLSSAGNLGIGVTPSAWSILRGLQVGLTASVAGYAASSEGAFFSSNSFYDGSNYKYQVTGFATAYVQINGFHSWQRAASGTANANITFTESMRLHTTGNLVLGGTVSTDSGERLQVNGTAKITGKILANGSTTSVSALEIGSINFQYFAINNAFIAENTFYNGSAFQRINTGLASVCYFAGGGFQVGTLPSGAAGTTQASLNQRFFVTNEGKVSISDTITGGGSITQIATAVLQVDSTTKGFLPPRMTNAQRIAISSPAVGLIVYCTDAVEGLYVYKSMGWTFII